MATDKKGKQFRKRKAAESDDDEEELDVRSALEETKYLQRLRERGKGIDAEKLGTGAKAKEATEVPPEEAPNDSEHALLDTFKQETTVTVEDPAMQRYIEEELAKRRGTAVQKAEQATNENELFMTPEHLRVRKRGDVDLGSSWTTGIVEVQLPVDYKLKNIEETEAAKKQLAEQSRGDKSRLGSSIPANYSTDYHQRGKEFANNRRGPPQGKAHNASGEKGLAATDDMVLERFRKRETHKAMRK
ncbi:hypothetical protein KFL_003260110 [Klebsormidium nitens]|uniref:Hepatocellular carcinoma-associated antigen 59 family protein n=1 Tax=Klebsormidium nitens TaxID=105231 RepID=A0A1Y1IFZ6_KLENI|nr:hypothetical protein KFL_003260110 [Klebsormidium nitens]|eukprot:GAQ87028.1 hypothetical protein KFL_003260110 [Klebsormidium nitens]